MRDNLRYHARKFREAPDRRSGPDQHHSLISGPEVDLRPRVKSWRGASNDLPSPVNCRASDMSTIVSEAPVATGEQSLRRLP